MWTTNDGNVACRQLGFSQINAVTYTDNRYGSGSGLVNLGSLQCTGSEARLIDCRQGSTAGCSQQSAAGLACAPKVCNDYDVRLIGGSNEYEGRVEVCYNEAWGTICDDGFDSSDATVVCGQAGYSRLGAVALPSAAYGQGSGTVLLTTLECRGNESSLATCSGAEFLSTQPCQHSRDAGVMCQRRQSYPSNVRVITRSNTSVSVSWSEPVEYYSSIIKYRATCNSSSSSSTLQTQDGTTFNLIFNNLNPYTNYTCCVETLYTDETENAFGCATNTTLEGIPGPPTNLAVTPSLELCNQVQFTWDLPPPDERNGVIRQYRIRVVALDQSGFERTYTTTSTIELINDLQCCSSYEYSISAFTIGYGPPTPTRTTFKTLPDIVTRPVQGSVEVNDAQTLLVNWNTPQEIVDQGLTSYQLAITAQCFTNDQPTPPIVFSIRADEQISQLQYSQQVPGLQPFVPYFIRLVATICDSTTLLYNTTAYTQEDTRISAPVITAARRISNSEAGVTFDPQDEENADEFVVDYYLATDLNTPKLSDDNLVSSIRTTDPTVIIENLDACTSYWTTVTAVNCGTRISSTPQLIGLKEPASYELVANLASSVGPCSSWITVNTARKVMDIENGLRLPLVLCGYTIPCFGNSQWSCIANDPTKAIFTTSLVGYQEATSDEIKACIDEWFQDANGVRNITVDGNTQAISSSDTTAPTPGGINVPGWAWAVVAIGVVGMIVTILLVVIIILTRRRKEPKEVRHEQMLDDIESRSGHSIGIVDNPLYAEEEEGQRYSELVSKEKEAEAEFDATTEKGQAFSINFGPPIDDDDY